jgi:hypothetical protein
MPTVEKPQTACAPPYFEFFCIFMRSSARCALASACNGEKQTRAEVRSQAQSIAVPHSFSQTGTRNQLRESTLRESKREREREREREIQRDKQRETQRNTEREREREGKKETHIVAGEAIQQARNQQCVRDRMIATHPERVCETKLVEAHRPYLPR